MAKVTFITGNQGKADFLAKHIDYPIDHKKLDLDEIQSLDLREIAEHKARQAYSMIHSPVLVEDAAFSIEALGGLPGPFIKWFEISLNLKGICDLVAKLDNDRAFASVCFAYYDGERLELFYGELHGRVADRPRGEGGFGFDPILNPDSSDKTLAEMTEDELEQKSLRTSTVYPEIKKFLASLDIG